MARIRRKQGESLQYTKGIVIDGVEQDLSIGWSARMAVKPVSGGLGGVASLSKVITDQNTAATRYVFSITPTEMAALTPGDYHLISEIYNSTGNVNREDHDELQVSEQGIV